MADQIIHEMIAAFAVGCMDSQNYVQFKDYLQEDGDLPQGELGELQNIISMIPIILDLESPDPSIKDMVAKKLIGMKDEIKAKIINERKTLANTLARTKISDSKSNFTPPPPVKFQPRTLTYHTKDSFDDAFRELPEIDFKKTILKKNTTEKLLTKIDLFNPPETIKNNTIDDLKINTSLGTLPPIPVPAEEGPVSSNWIGIIGVVLSLLLFSIVGFFTFTSVSKLNDRVDELQNELVSVKSQLTTSNNFVNNYSSLIEFFNYKDIMVVNLTSLDPANKQTAKLLLSFNEKEGLIQFRSPQQLRAGQAFQLWAINKGQAYSLGSFQPVNNEYLKISFPFLPKEQIEEYKITIESANGTPTPSASIYLTSFTRPARRGL